MQLFATPLPRFGARLEIQLSPAEHFTPQALSDLGGIAGSLKKIAAIQGQADDRVNTTVTINEKDRKCDAMLSSINNGTRHLARGENQSMVSFFQALAMEIARFSKTLLTRQEYLERKVERAATILSKVTVPLAAGDFSVIRPPQKKGDDSEAQVRIGKKTWRILEHRGIGDSYHLRDITRETKVTDCEAINIHRDGVEMILNIHPSGQSGEALCLRDLAEQVPDLVSPHFVRASAAIDILQESVFKVKKPIHHRRSR